MGAIQYRHRFFLVYVLLVSGDRIDNVSGLSMFMVGFGLKIQEIETSVNKHSEKEHFLTSIDFRADSGCSL